MKRNPLAILKKFFSRKSAEEELPPLDLSSNSSEISDKTNPNYELPPLMPLEEESNFYDQFPKKSFIEKIKGFFTSSFTKSKKEISLNPKKGKRPFSFELRDITWNDFIDSLYNPKHRPLLHHLFILGVFAISCYTVGKGIGTWLDFKFSVFSNNYGKGDFVRPKAIQQQDLILVKNANLFHADDKDIEKEVVERKKLLADKKCETAETVTTLPYKVLGSIVLQDPKKSLVTLIFNNKTLSFRKEEKIGQHAEIGNITEDKIIFKNLINGSCEYLSLKNPGGAENSNLTILPEKQGAVAIKQAKPEGIKAEGNSFKIDKAFRNKMLENISGVLTQARAIQINNPDGSLCFKIVDIAAGSLYSHLNIQDNDIICKIDGQNISNLNQIMNMFGRIKEIDNLQLSINRNGQEQQLDYKFE